MQARLASSPRDDAITAGKKLSNSTAPGDHSAGCKRSDALRAFTQGRIGQIETDALRRLHC